MVNDFGMGSISQANAVPPSSATSVRCTNRAADQESPACSNIKPSLGASLYLSTSICASRFRVVSICWRTCASAFPLPFFLVTLGAPRRRALIRSTSEDFTYLETINHATMATAHIPSATITKEFINSDLRHFFKQVRAQPDAGAQKLLV